MIRVLTIISLLLSFTTICNSQQIENYQPYSSLESDSFKYLEQYDDKLKKELDSIETYKREYKEVLEKRNERLKHKIENQHYIQDSLVSSYFNFILKEICSNNEELNENEITLFIARYPWENAVCYSEGTIIFNLGLYRKLKSESQIAMILAHELAHYYFRHGNKSITEYVERVNSDEFKEEVKEIEDMEFNRRKKALELLKGITYNDRRHSRDHESESDSMALQFLINTRYNLENAIGGIMILDSIDKDKYTDKIIYAELFDHDQYPFKRRWLIKEEESIFGAPVEQKSIDGINRDSLKTHPDCLNRFQVLQKQVSEIPEKTRSTFLQDSSIFEQLIYESDFEYISSYLATEEYGKALYYGLKLYQKYPNNVFLVNSIGKCFYHFYQAQKQHELGKYVDLESFHYTDEYNEFLTFIHNLRLGDYKMLGYLFMKEKYSKFKVEESYLYQLILNTSILGNETLLEVYKAEYLNSFPEGKNLEKIQSINN
jgi:predicted metal-dependent hydrolase